MRSTVDGVPQPWEAEGLTRDAYIEFAESLEAQGPRLVVRYLFDAYADDDYWSWVVDTTVLTDWRTGEHVATLTDDDDDSIYEASRNR